MISGKMFQHAAKRTVQLSSIAAVGISLTAAHPASHQTPQPPASAQPVAPADAATPVGTVAAFHAALARGDTAAALALLTEDVMIFESGGVENSRAEYASHHLHTDAAFSAAVPRTLVNRTHGAQGDTAWVMSVETVSGIYRERPINSRSVETMLLRRVGSDWRIAHIHWSSANVPPVSASIR